MIRSLTIRGFRGIVHPLSIDLVKDGQPASLMVFGRNGTGKSSITDAWEWFRSGSIEHLAREGARSGAYPSRLPGGAIVEDAFVEIAFQDPGAGTVRLPLPGGRGAAGVNEAGHEWFCARTTHPCHIRFDDLGRFVYLTKTQRFDELANLMGFTEQVELQKQLRRVESKLADSVTRGERDMRTAGNDVARHFKLPEDSFPSEADVIAKYTSLFGRNGLGDTPTWSTIERATAELQARVEHDKNGPELLAVTGLVRALQRLNPPEAEVALNKYVEAVDAFRAQERAAVADMLIALYDSGKKAVEHARVRLATHGDGEGDHCPLCGREYEGDLIAHIETELEALAAVRAARAETEALRASVKNAIPAGLTLAKELAQAITDAGPSGKQFAFADLITHARDIDTRSSALRREVGTKAEALTDTSLAQMREVGALLEKAVEDFGRERRALLAAMQLRVDALTDDGARAKLLDDHTKAVRGRELWDASVSARKSAVALFHVHDEFRSLVDRYVAMNIADVDERFAAISVDVDRYFAILEANTDGVSHPALRLLKDQERAVVLEIEFRGDRVAPAYSYLSESQLNSFGLAVFLASVRFINRDFRVVILDDVVNSFDAYKRPQLIQLLKQEFQDFQVILFTHDDVWWTEMLDQCPSWTRLRFKRYEAGIGPITETSPKSELERVQAYLADDEPTSAARELGPMLERKLQALCDAMQVSVTYNARNEYTLRPLLQCLVSRAKEKLGAAHPLYMSAKALEENTTFRNFSAHAKNPASGITTPEMQLVLDLWLHIDSLVRCQHPRCGTMTAWRGAVSDFACRCGKTVLSKAAAAPKTV